MDNNSTGQTFASVSWLTNHYLAKSPQLSKYIATLPINSGDSVLDLGCGIGTYMDSYLKMVGKHGKVVGVDHDRNCLTKAQEILTKGVFSNWELREGDIIKDLSIVCDFDKIILFNCLSYFKSPEKIIEQIYSKMSKHSVLIVKDFDMTTSSYNPIDKRLHGSLIESVKKATYSQKNNSINKLFGCSLHRIARKISRDKHQSGLWSYIFTYPFSQNQVDFMKNAFKNSIEIAHDFCDEETYIYINNAFISDNAFFYECEHSVFVENEHVVMLTA